MPFNFESYLGVHAPALNLQARRAQVLASNLANADTPGYKARDIDFRNVLQGLDSGMQSGNTLRMTHQRHLASDLSGPGGYELLYRQPGQPSLDGNTVEQQVEMAAYADNAMRYLTSLRFLSGKFNTMRTAIKGQ